VLAKEPDVVIVTGDHSTPAALREHSWHGVPTLLASRWARPSAKEFGESACRTGDLGHFHGTDLVPLALAHAGRLVKFGA
jgi:2,3-bisphosphoglycerate-independent phosphoglycerate mutase